jgi:prevent-host-death family protein
LRTVGLFEAKQKLSELVNRAARGERTGITRRGKLTALLVPAQSSPSVKEIFENIDRIRRRVKKVKGLTVRSLIDEGRV